MDSEMCLPIDIVGDNRLWKVSTDMYCPWQQTAEGVYR